MSDNYLQAVRILKKAQSNGITLVNDGGNLKIMKTRGDQLPDAFLHDIKKYRNEVMELLDTLTDGAGTPQVEIERRPPQYGKVPLSFSQERIWFLDKLQGTIHYHMPTVFSIKGDVQPDLLEGAIRAVIDRHEVLRTVVREDKGLPYQTLLQADNWKLDLITSMFNTYADEPCRSMVGNLINMPFDLSNDYVLRAHMIHLKRQTLLVMIVHHIASDAWSTGILTHEMMHFYSLLIDEQKEKLPDLPIQYADYAIWQRQLMQGEDYQKKLSFWNKHLSAITPMNLSTDFPLTSQRSLRGSISYFTLDQDLTKSIKLLAQEHDATIYMTLLAVFKILLFKYTGQRDICIGTPVANRMRWETENLIGFFVNTLAIRSFIGEKENFTQFLGKIKETCILAFENQDVPFEKVVEALGVEREINKNPVFQIMFIVQNAPEGKALTFPKLDLQMEDSDHRIAKFDLVFCLWETDGKIAGCVEYATDIWTKNSVSRMIGHYQQLLTSLIPAPEKDIASLDILTQWEKYEIEKVFNPDFTAVKHTSFFEYFEDCVAKMPNHPALIVGESLLTYEQLHGQANQLTNYLVRQGVKPGDVIHVCLPRTTDLIVAILSIIRAGAAYIPIDSEYPKERVQYILNQSHSATVLTVAALEKRFSSLDTKHIINLDLIRDQIQHELPFCALQNISDDMLAYVIYTSGSTGKPKGCMIHHGALNSFINSIGDLIDFRHKKMYSLATVCFDMFVADLFLPLSFGGTIVLANEAEQIDASLAYETLLCSNIDILQTTPSRIKTLLESGKTNFLDRLKLLMVGGEPFPKDLIRAIKQRTGARIMNLYGLTETTVYSSYHIIENELAPMMIGKPLSNTNMLILDDHGSQQPIGIPGEIYIAGRGVGQGYFQNDILTDERFIKNSIAKRLYKTGDFGRWLPDGTIEYLGRADDQVKIRGYRVELAEIEFAIKQYEYVRAAVVLAKTENDGSMKLVGYVVFRAGGEPEKVISDLRTVLPDYMIPYQIVRLQELPFNANGKVDKKKLRAMQPIVVSNHYIPPRNKVERLLFSIWSELLGVDKIGVKDNFFTIGGHSLIMVQALSEMRELNFEVDLKDLFIHQTIEAQAKLIAEHSERKRSMEPSSNCFRKHLRLLNDGNAEKPVFIFPGGEGLIDGYKEFAEWFDRDFRVYGVQMYGLEDGERPFVTIDEIAKVNIQWIKEAQPAGPYRLIGDCFGGIVAFETARKLEILGEKVDLLTIFETAPRSKKTFLVADYPDVITDAVAYLLESFGVINNPFPRWIHDMKLGCQALEGLEIVNFISDVLSNELGDSDSMKFKRRLSQVEMTNLLIVLNYRCEGHVKSPILAITASGEDWSHHNKTLGWDAHGDVTAVCVDGSHSTMVDHASSEQLASLIKSQIPPFVPVQGVY